MNCPDSNGSKKKKDRASCSVPFFCQRALEDSNPRPFGP